MNFAGLHLKGLFSRRAAGGSRVARRISSAGFMPKRIFLRLFLSTLAAMLAIHFWKNSGR